MAALSIPTFLFRETPDRPERPERERRAGPGRWFFVTLAVFALILVLNRLLGPAWVAGFWAVGLGAYFAVQGWQIWNNRRGPRN